MQNEEVYLRAILATVARQTFPVEELMKLVAPVGEKQILAYNLCDGTRTQSEVAKEVGLDGGAFSRTVARWVDLGILLKVGQNREVRLVHLYPLPLKKAKADA